MASIPCLSKTIGEKNETPHHFTQAPFSIVDLGCTHTPRNSLASEALGPCVILVSFQRENLIQRVSALWEYETLCSAADAISKNNERQTLDFKHKSIFFALLLKIVLPCRSLSSFGATACLCGLMFLKGKLQLNSIFPPFKFLSSFNTNPCSIF